MRLSSEILAPFVGGEAEIQCTFPGSQEGYLFRGKIQSAAVSNETLVLTFVWLAKGIGFPPLPSGGWKREEIARPYAASLLACEAQDIGPGTEGGNRLCLSFAVTNETVILFPPDGSKLQE